MVFVFAFVWVLAFSNRKFTYMEKWRCWMMRCNREYIFFGLIQNSLRLPSHHNYYWTQTWLIAQRNDISLAHKARTVWKKWLNTLDVWVVKRWNDVKKWQTLFRNWSGRSRRNETKKKNTVWVYLLFTVISGYRATVCTHSSLPLALSPSFSPIFEPSSKVIGFYRCSMHAFVIKSFRFNLLHFYHKAIHLSVPETTA